MGPAERWRPFCFSLFERFISRLTMQRLDLFPPLRDSTPCSRSLQRQVEWMGSALRGQSETSRQEKENPMIPGPSELILILLIVVMVFGAKRIPEIMQGLGQGIRAFKKSVESDEPPSTPASQNAENQGKPGTKPPSGPETK